MAEFDLVRGIGFDPLQKKVVGVVIIGLIAFLVINEKLSRSERWHPRMWLLFLLAICLAVVLLFYA